MSTQKSLATLTDDDMVVLPLARSRNQDSRFHRSKDCKHFKLNRVSTVPFGYVEDRQPCTHCWQTRERDE